MNPDAPLAVTMGDPAGIGGELTLRAWQRRAAGMRPFVAIDDPARLADLARKLSIDVPISEVSNPSEALSLFKSVLPVLPMKLAADQPAGQPVAANAPTTLSSIEHAVRLAQTGQVSGVVTNPINKAALYEGAGFAYPGHTEFLAALSGVKHTVMMLAAPGLRVVPVTIHIALQDVPNKLTKDAIIDTARIAAHALNTDFGIDRPRLAVAGLNPHAGEGGAMGNEEIETIIPAVSQLREEGIDAVGPLPADTMFHAQAREGYDAALCMYHDQALIPLKTLDFHGGVNVTLGLPFVRTSPDHGTAYDIAGQGIANPSSFIAALGLADECARNRVMGDQQTLDRRAQR